MKQLYLFTFTLFAFVSCSTVKLSEEGKKVKLVKSELQNCDEVGDLDGSSQGFSGASMSKAKADLRNKAAELGATHIVIDSTAGNGATLFSINGRAHKCK